MSAEAIQFSFCVGKAANEGEDAEPVLLADPQWISLLAVFDGLGGAGSAAYTRDGLTHSGAYFASRFARELLLKYWQEWKPETPPEQRLDIFVGKLNEYLLDGFRRAAAGFGENSSRIVSTMIKRLPTTMAAVWVEQMTPENGQLVFSVWAGDSRVYALQPESGLTQLTVDDLVKAQNALENLRGDSPISNCINADTDFRLHFNQISFQRPFVVLAASDGCFGYLPTPMHFEFLLLDSLMRAADVEGWKKNILQDLQRVAGDDVSMALMAFEFDSFAGLKIAFQRRYNELWQQYIQPLNDLYLQNEQLNRQMETVKRELESRLAVLWKQYQRGYETYIMIGNPPREERKEV